MYIDKCIHVMCPHMGVSMHTCPIFICIYVRVCQAMKRTFCGYQHSKLNKGISTRNIRIYGYIIVNVKSQVLCKNDRSQNGHQKIAGDMNHFLHS